MKYTQPLNEEENAHYVNGDPSIGQTGSIIPAGALENPQREIVNAITDAGLTPSASSNSQLAQAISAKITAASNTLQALINGKQATVTGAATTITGSNLTASRALVSSSSGKVAVSAVTATELGYLSGVTSAIQTQINGKQATVTGAASTVTTNNLTASRALISAASGKIQVSDTTSTELSYVHGVTSAIQTQINGKQATVTGAATTITGSNLTASRALVSSSSGKVAVSAVTATELGYLSGVTSAIQTQINGTVKTSGDQTIDGAKTFTKGVTVHKSDPRVWLENDVVIKGTAPSSNSVSAFQFRDKNHELLGSVHSQYQTDKKIITQLLAYKALSASDTASVRMGVGYDADGNIITYAPACDHNESIVTTISKSKAANGYFKLGNGLIVQWGTATCNSGNNNISFPTAFSNTNYRIVSNLISSTNNLGAGAANSIYNKSTTGCIIQVRAYPGVGIGAASSEWLAIGY